MARFEKGGIGSRLGQAMTRPWRKLAGTVLLIAIVAIYALVASAVATAWLAGAPAWAHLLYFLATGALWVLPAMALIRWMLRP